MPMTVRVLGAAVLAVVAASAPVMGFAAAEHYEGRRFYGVLEGDWFFLFGLVAAAACTWSARELLRRRA